MTHTQHTPTLHPPSLRRGPLRSLLSRRSWQRCGAGAGLLLMLLLTGGCDRSGQRLKENPPPNPLVRKKVEGVQGHLLAGKPDALFRSASLNAADAAKALQGFVYEAKSTYHLKRGKKQLRLEEEMILNQKADGSFHVKVTNNRQKGYETIWTQRTLYHRKRFRPFRVISGNVDDAHRWQLRSFGRWRAIVGLFGPRLALSRMGEGNHMGRACQRYQIALYKEAQTQKTFPKGTAFAGRVSDHTRGDAAKLPRTPVTAKGQLWIDQKTGLPLKVRFQGTYLVGKGKDAGRVTLSLRASFRAAKANAIGPPKDLVEVKREKDAHDPFGRKKPAFLQPPPREDSGKKGR